MATPWFGNTIATVTITSSVFSNTASDIFVISNLSQVTQDFTYLAGYEQNLSISPAQVTLSVTDSNINGDLVDYDGSTIDITFPVCSSWTLAAVWGYGSASIAVHLDSTSNFTLTAHSRVENTTSALDNLDNVFCNRFALYYDSLTTVSSWLNNRTIALSGGGKATPARLL